MDPYTIALIAAAIAGAARAANAAKTARKQDRIAAEGIRTQSKIQDKQNTAVNDVVTEFENSNPDEEIRRRNMQQMRLLQSNQGLTNSGFDIPGAVSDAFTDKAAQAKGETSEFGRMRSDIASRTDGPLDQRQGEGFSLGDLSADSALFGRNSRAEDFLTRMRIAGVRPNKLLSLVEGIATGVSTGASFSGGGGGGKGGSTTTPAAGKGGSAGAPVVESVPSWVAQPQSATGGKGGFAAQPQQSRFANNPLVFS